MFTVVADTNVYVSALAFGGTPERFLRLAEAGVFELVTSDAITAEIKKVLQSKKFGWPEQQTAQALRQIGRLTKHVVPGEMLHVVRVDPTDDRILECAAAAGAEFIVSGDKHLLRLHQFGRTPIIKISDFLEKIRDSR